MTELSKRHWAQHRERGNLFFLRCTAWLACHAPYCLLASCIWGVVGYFFITSARERRHIADYQQRLHRVFPHLPLPRFGSVWQQFLAFAEAITDRFAVWQHRISYDDLILDDVDNVYADVRASARQGAAGAILVCSHLGNIEVCRALVQHHQGFVLNVLVHNAHAQQFNDALRQAGADHINMIQVTELDMSRMMDLQQRLAQGEWLAIAADRIPVRGDKTISIPFLGKTTEWPQGPWLLAGLLKAPLISVFCYKKKHNYHLRLRRFAATPHWQRESRKAMVTELATQFVRELEQQCACAPLQWFNFYDFWNDDAQTE